MISVLLLTRDRASLLARCLASLARQEPVAEPWEVVVLDTGSRDPTPALLERWAVLPGLPYRLRWGAESGAGAFAAGRNRVVELAGSDRLLMVDDDCELPADWLRRGARLLDDYDAAGGLVLGANALPFGRAWHPEMVWTVGLAMPGTFRPEDAGSLYYPQTACLAIHRAVWERHRFAGVREAFGEGGGIYRNEREDSALWLRLRRAGARLLFDPTWIAYHATPPERARVTTGLRRAWRDGDAEALQRFNPEAARTAAESVGRDVWGAAANALTALVARRGATSPLPQSPPVLPPLAWAMRETAHARRFARQAPGKWGRSLVAPLLRGLVRGGVDQARRALGSLVPPVRSTWPAVPERPSVVEVHAAPFLGDLVLLESVLRALAQQPDAPAVVLHLPDGAGPALYRHCPFVKLVSRAEYSTRPRLEAGWRERRERENVAVIPYWQTATFRDLTHWRFGVDRLATVAFDRDMGFARRRHYGIATQLVRKNPTLHEVENLARLFQWAGLATRPASPCLDFVPDTPALLPRVPAGCIAVQMSTLRPQKLWSEGRWASALSALASRTGRPLVFLGSAAEADATRAFIAAHALKDATLWADLPDGATVEGLVTLLRRAGVLLTTCSGPKHIAYAVGCPTVTLHGESDERRWGYWPTESAENAKHRTLRAMPFGLTPGERAGYLPNQEMLAIEPEQVVEAAQTVMRG